MEKVAGIIAEYNPLHRGHVHHMAETRRLLGGECAIVCVMSGDFVQRGSPAVFDKFARAAAAARAGADLVLELPLPWSLSSAEGFARGGVSMLAAAGVVTHLSFGSETGKLPLLQGAAAALADPGFSALLRRELPTGVSFPAARLAALAQTLGADAAVLSHPNDLLAVEYLRAVHDLAAPLAPLAVPRVGAGHDESGASAYPSASELRSRMERGVDVSPFAPFLPDAPPVFPPDLEIALLSRLRMLPRSAWAQTPGAAEGLENVLYRAARSEPTVETILAAAKSKRYPMSRLRRMVLCAALGVPKEIGLPPYLRVLAANERGRGLLRRMAKEARLPVITKPAAVKSLSETAQSVFRLNSDAHDFYRLARPGQTPGQDWRQTPCMVSSAS